MARAGLIPGEIRVGLDVVVVSFRGADPSASLPVRLGTYARQQDRRLPVKPDRAIRPNYARLASYLDPTVPDGFLLDVLYEPRLPQMPAFRARIRARMSRLIATATDLDELARVVESIQSHVGGHSRVAQLELALDHAGVTENAARALKAQVYCPRMRKSRTKSRSPDGEPLFWEARGSKTSPVWLRIYAKDEDGLQCTRTELIIQGPSNLAHLGIDNIRALRHADWTTLFDRHVRLVKFEHGDCETRPRPIAPYVNDMMARLGPNELLRKVSRADRRYIRRHLQETPLGRRITESLRTLCDNFAEFRSASLESQSKYQCQFGDIARVV